jgi:peptide/nickel transport system permease protein
VARFVIRRLLQALIVLALASVFTFLIFQVIPNGNPAYRLAGREATPETIAAVSREWGFDKPIYTQYLITMKKVFTGSVVSYSQQVNVLSSILRGLPATISLAVGASVIWLAWAILLALVGALKPGTVIDRALALVSLTLISTPVFVVGSILLYVLAYKSTIFPNGGYVPLTENPWQWFLHMLLPWISLSLAFIGFYSRVLRANMLDTINEDYVRMARAKGLSRRRVLFAHVLRTSLIPVVSLWGLDFAGVIGGGAILIENVYNLQGVGQYAAESVQTLDVPPILVIVMFTAFIVVIMAALVDIAYAFLDPRVQLNAS